MNTIIRTTKETDGGPPMNKPLYDDTPARTAPVERQPPSSEVLDLARRLPRGLYLGTNGWADTRWRGLIFSESSGIDRLFTYGLSPYARHPLFKTVAIPWVKSGYRESEWLRFLSSVDETFRFILPLPHPSLDPMVRNPKGMGIGENEHFLKFSPDDWAKHLIAPVQVLGKQLGPVVLRLGEFDRGLVKRYVRQGDLIPRIEAFLGDMKNFLQTTGFEGVLGFEIQNGEWLTPRLMKALKRLQIRPVLRLSLGLPGLLRQQQALAYWETEKREERPTWTATGPVLIHWAGSPSLMLGYRKLDAKTLVASDPVMRAMIVILMEKTLSAGENAWLWVANRAEGSAPLTLKAIADEIVSRRESKLRGHK